MRFDITVTKKLILINIITLSDMAGNQRYVFLDHNNQFVADQNAKHTYSNVHIVVQLDVLHHLMFDAF
jgi:hypothetical protein